MTFANLARTLLDRTIVPLEKSGWSAEITVPGSSVSSGWFSSQNEFWKQVLQLREYTDSSADKFSKQHQGSTGWEYSMDMLYVNGNFFYTKAHTSRDYEKVSTGGHKVEIKPQFDQKAITLKDQILLDGVQIGQMVYKGEKEIKARGKLIEQHTFKWGFVCHFHSHPQVQVLGSEKRVYSFFSDTDLRSFLGNNQQLSGLVGDRLWLLAKTTTSSMPSLEDLHAVSRAELTDSENFEQIAADTMSKYGIVLYVAKFKAGKLLRLN